MTTRPQQLPFKNRRAVSASRTDGQASCNGGMPDTACSEPGASVDVRDPSAALSLGHAVDAAGREPAVLDGVGALLPAWREVARLIAPMCHQVMAVTDYAVSNFP